MFNISNKTKAIIISSIAGVLAICICIGFFSSDFYTFQKAKKAYKSIDAAYEELDDFSSDVYKAWSKGVNNEKQVKGEKGLYYHTYAYMEGLEYLADGMNVSLDDIKKGVLVLDNSGVVPTEYDYSKVESAYKSVLSDYDNTFSACVNIMIETYKATGRAGEINLHIEQAKKTMRSMSKNHSEYVHYPALNDYLANTIAIYEFCSTPTGTFESASTTLSAYKAEAQKVHFSLNYIFAE